MNDYLQRQAAQLQLKESRRSSPGFPESRRSSPGFPVYSPDNFASENKKNTNRASKNAVYGKELCGDSDKDPLTELTATPSVLYLFKINAQMTCGKINPLAPSFFQNLTLGIDDIGVVERAIRDIIAIFEARTLLLLRAAAEAVLAHSERILPEKSLRTTQNDSVDQSQSGNREKQPRDESRNESEKGNTKKNDTTKKLLAEVATSEAGVQLCKVSEAHAEVLIIQSFCNGLKRAKPQVSSHELLRLHTLLLLHLLTLLEEHLGDFLVYGLVQEFLEILHASQHTDNTTTENVPIQGIRPFSFSFLKSAIADGIYQLCDRIRPDSVNLIEAWQFSDFRIGSSIGSSDGHIYDNLIRSAENEPLNVEAMKNGNVSEGYTKYLRHVINRPYVTPKKLVRSRL